METWRSVCEELPKRLSERCRPVAAGEGAPDEEPLEGGFVLYWMRNAARAHENPALDVAVAAANAVGRRAFVYHGVSEDYPYASDRHHTFVLEGAREVAAECAEREIGYALHVERPGHREPHLGSLADRAALVVVEEVPVEPLRTWRPALAAATETPVVAVDADCVVPMRLVGRLYDRAYKFRNAVEEMREQRIGREWEDVEAASGAGVPEGLGFEPLEIEEVDISSLVGACEIDHAVGPAPGTPGGAGAGYGRWRDFRDERLDDYNRRRNTPSDPEGVSRISPYLHWGQISPLRVAREAASRDSKGARKYVDELVTWRELAHHFCFYDPRHGTVDALPDWALESFREHESDERPALYDWERLARATTDDELWNLCQTSLLRHGELHNNVRMTWAKKLLEWTPSIDRALELALDLNHRYALDGSDPNSYHGIQWCFGAFDRPYDERPILGKVRPRDTDWHEGRIDMDSYAEFVRAPSVDEPPRIAVVGGGVAGATCARTLADHGLNVEVYDKGRGAGGRLSTRRAESGEDEIVRFDHGAPSFEVEDERFRRYLEAWREQGIVARWTGRFVELAGPDAEPVEREADRFVGTPKMNQLVRHLGADLDVSFGVRVGSLEDDGGRWRVIDEHGESLGVFDAVVATPPAPQTAELLEGTGTPLLAAVREARMLPIWTAMISFDSEVPVDFDVARIRGGPLGLAVRNASKPGRGAAETWVLHASHEWSSERLEEGREEVAEALERAFRDLARGGVRGVGVAHRSAHRWRYGRVDDAAGRDALYDESRALVLAGDWVAGPGVERAFLSGCAAAGHLLRELGDRVRGGRNG